MINENDQGFQLETELVRATERSARAEQGIQRDLDGQVGALTHHQRRLLDDLVRLHHSLRAPEAVLDRGSYSRAFPPRPHSSNYPKD